VVVIKLPRFLQHENPIQVKMGRVKKSPKKSSHPLAKAATKAEESLPEDYSEWTLVQLREVLKGRGLPTYGTKLQLIQRLGADSRGETPPKGRPGRSKKSPGSTKAATSKDPKVKKSKGSAPKDPPTKSETGSEAQAGPSHARAGDEQLPDDSNDSVPDSTEDKVIGVVEVDPKMQVEVRVTKVTDAVYRGKVEDSDSDSDHEEAKLKKFKDDSDQEDAKLKKSKGSRPKKAGGKAGPSGSKPSQDSQSEPRFWQDQKGYFVLKVEDGDGSANQDEQRDKLERCQRLPVHDCVECTTVGCCHCEEPCRWRWCSGATGATGAAGNAGKAGKYRECRECRECVFTERCVVCRAFRFTPNDNAEAKRLRSDKRADTCQNTKCKDDGGCCHCGERVRRLGQRCVSSCNFKPECVFCRATAAITN